MRPRKAKDARSIYIDAPPERSCRLASALVALSYLYALRAFAVHARIVVPNYQTLRAPSPQGLSLFRKGAQKNAPLSSLSNSDTVKGVASRTFMLNVCDP